MKQIEFIDSSNLARILTIGNQLSFITADDEYRENPVIKYEQLRQFQELIRDWKLRLQDKIVINENITYNRGADPRARWMGVPLAGRTASERSRVECLVPPRVSAGEHGTDEVSAAIPRDAVARNDCITRRRIRSTGLQ